GSLVSAHLSTLAPHSRSCWLACLSFAFLFLQQGGSQGGRTRPFSSVEAAPILCDPCVGRDQGCIQTIQLETATIKLEIWDTAGQEKYHSVCHLYYRGAHAALLVYDLTNKETLNRAKQWLMELEKEFLPDEIVIALVGNKTDLADEREVAAEDGEEFARSRSLLFMETSAKSNHQVNDVFMAVAQELLRREGKKAAVPSTGDRQRLDLQASRTRRGCCHV
uniref:RAB17, member RAS onco family n=1 Tax=Gallus gallus TaxID=9031 RepID=A0A8V0YEQ7_CHICK